MGSNAGYDPFMFKLRGADHVLACEPFEFIEQALFLESVYRSGVDFQRIGWQQLDPETTGPSTWCTATACSTTTSTRSASSRDCGT